MCAAFTATEAKHIVCRANNYYQVFSQYAGKRRTLRYNLYIYIYIYLILSISLRAATNRERKLLIRGRAGKARVVVIARERGRERETAQRAYSLARGRYS